VSVEQALRIVLVLFVLAFAFTFVEEAHCQTVSFGPQGAEVLAAMVGRTVPGVAAIDVQICSKKDLRLSSGLVYQAAVAAGIQPISPLAIDAVISSELGRNRWRILASTLNIGTHTGTILLASGLIAATNSWTAGFAVASGLADTVADRLRARVPTFAWRKDLLEGDLILTGENCVARIMFARYTKSLTPRMADLGSPKIVERPVLDTPPPPTEPILLALAELERVMERKH
jgi:hypothetical protein